MIRTHIILGFSEAQCKEQFKGKAKFGWKVTNKYCFITATAKIIAWQLINISSPKK